MLCTAAGMNWSWSSDDYRITAWSLETLRHLMTVDATHVATANIKALRYLKRKSGAWRVYRLKSEFWVIQLVRQFDCWEFKYEILHIYMYIFNWNTPETTNPLSYLHLLFFSHFRVFVFAFICLFSFVKINACLLNSVSHYNVNITVYFLLLSLLCTMHHLSLTVFDISPVLSAAVNNIPKSPTENPTRRSCSLTRCIWRMWVWEFTLGCFMWQFHCLWIHK